MIQNCLNEIAKIDLPSLKTNVKTLCEFLPSNAYFLMSDMTSVAKPIMNVLESFLVGTFSPKFIRTTLSSGSRSLISVHHRPSAIINYISC